jgi:hypothetical protein
MHCTLEVPQEGTTHPTEKQIWSDCTNLTVIDEDDEERKMTIFRQIGYGIHVRPFDVPLFSAADCDTDHYPMVVKVKKRLAANKKITQILYGEVQYQEAKRYRRQREVSR